MKRKPATSTSRKQKLRKKHSAENLESSDSDDETMVCEGNRSFKTGEELRKLIEVRPKKIFRSAELNLRRSLIRRNVEATHFASSTPSHIAPKVFNKSSVISPIRQNKVLSLGDDVIGNLSRRSDESGNMSPNRSKDSEDDNSKTLVNDENNADASRSKSRVINLPNASRSRLRSGTEHRNISDEDLAHSAIDTRTSKRENRNSSVRRLANENIKPGGQEHHSSSQLKLITDSRSPSGKVQNRSTSTNKRRSNSVLDNVLTAFVANERLSNDQQQNSSQLASPKSVSDFRSPFHNTDRYDELNNKSKRVTRRETSLKRVSDSHRTHNSDVNTSRGLDASERVPHRELRRSPRQLTRSRHVSDSALPGRTPRENGRLQLRQSRGIPEQIDKRAGDHVSVPSDQWVDDLISTHMDPTPSTSNSSEQLPCDILNNDNTPEKHSFQWKKYKLDSIVSHIKQKRGIPLESDGNNNPSEVLAFGADNTMTSAVHNHENVRYPEEDRAAERKEETIGKRRKTTKKQTETKKKQIRTTPDVKQKKVPAARKRKAKEDTASEKVADVDPETTVAGFRRSARTRKPREMANIAVFYVDSRNNFIPCKSETNNVRRTVYLKHREKKNNNKDKNDDVDPTFKLPKRIETKLNKKKNDRVHSRRGNDESGIDLPTNSNESPSLTFASKKNDDENPIFKLPKPTKKKPTKSNKTSQSVEHLRVPSNSRRGTDESGIELPTNSNESYSNDRPEFSNASENESHNPLRNSRHVTVSINNTTQSIEWFNEGLQSFESQETSQLTRTVHVPFSVSSGYYQLSALDKKLKQTSGRYSMIFYVVEGTATVVLQDRCRTARPGSSFFVPTGSSYSITNMSRNDKLVLFFVRFLQTN